MCFPDAGDKILLSPSVQGASLHPDPGEQQMHSTVLCRELGLPLQLSSDWGLQQIKLTRPSPTLHT